MARLSTRGLLLEVLEDPSPKPKSMLASSKKKKKKKPDRLKDRAAD